MGVSAEVSVLEGFGIPDRASDEGAVIGNVAAVEEVLGGFDELPNKEPEGGGPNMFGDTADLKELNELVGGLKLPKPPKGDAVEAGGLTLSFSDESS